MLLYELSMDVWRVGVSTVHATIREGGHSTCYYMCGGLVMSTARAAICVEGW